MMKTQDIMKARYYNSVGGPLDCVPASEVCDFLQRIEFRITDVEDGTITLDQLYQEIRGVRQTLRKGE